MNSTSRTGGSIPGVGKVELSWASTPAAVVANAAGAPVNATNAAYGADGVNGSGDGKDEMKKEEAAAGGDMQMAESGQGMGEEDYDVADGDEGDRWMR